MNERMATPTRDDPRRRTPRGLPARLLVVVASLIVVLATPRAARADDLIALINDPAVELSGVHHYGAVYIDTTLRLVGDTTISADSVYIGPNTQLRSCDPPGGALQNTCSAVSSLAITATGSIVVAGDIFLAAPDQTPRRGGGLTLAGASVTIAGTITTDGYQQPSGGVVIAASGAVRVHDIEAFGAPVTITGSPVTTGAIRSHADQQIDLPSAARTAAGGAITIGSSGPVSTGDLTSWGDPAQPNQPGGDPGAIMINAAGISVGHVDATPGSDGGAPADVELHSSAGIRVRDSLTISPNDATTGNGPIGGRVVIDAAGDVNAAGISDAGARGATNGGAGGSITIDGASVSLGTIQAGGANGGDTAGRGGGGGAVTITAASTLTTGSIDVSGGYGGATGTGGNGGGVTASAAAATISTVTAAAGYSSNGAGANGGAVAVRAADGLVTSGVDTSATSGTTAGTDPGAAGGAGGPILLSAGAGGLVTSGIITSAGGDGDSTNQTGGRGGNGGPIDLVGSTIDLTGLISRGGAGGYATQRGPGGDGGRIRAFTPVTPFTGQRFVASDGGDGTPVGSDGLQTVNGPPASVAITPRGISFTSTSPDATGYRVLAESAGGGNVTVGGSPTAGVIPVHAAAWCTTTTYSVVAVNAPIGWVSPASGGVTTLREPNGGGSCRRAPRISTADLTITARRVRHAHGRVHLTLRSSATGTLAVTLGIAGRRILIFAGPVSRGVVRLTIRLPAPRAGVHYTVIFAGHALIGPARTITTTRIVLA
jgi:hypothetical protein